MDSDESRIRNISDTARWVAEYRAEESERPDAVFRDPFARRLAGTRGHEITGTIPRQMQQRWAFITRTYLFDHFVAEQVRAGVDTVKIGDNNIEFGYFPKRTRIKPGTTVTFTNAGDTPHTATSFENGKIGNWDTGPLASGESKAIQFDKPGNYYYICTPHPWMYGQIIVE